MNRETDTMTDAEVQSAIATLLAEPAGSFRAEHAALRLRLTAYMLSLAPQARHVLLARLPAQFFDGQDVTDDPTHGGLYDIVPEQTVEEMAARTRARQARLADAQRLFVEDDDQPPTPDDPALIQVLSRGSILPPDA